MSSVILGPKTSSIGAFATQGVLSVIFDQTDILNRMTYGVLGECSAAIDIVNNGPYPIFIGLTIETLDQVITIADRINIGFVAPSSRSTISYASVPQLAQLPDGITKFTIKIYHYGGTDATYTITTSLRLDTPINTLSSSPIIGVDTSVYESDFFQSLNNDAVIPANGTTTAFSFTFAAQVSRVHLHSIYLKCVPTAYNDDIILQCRTLNPAGTVTAILAQLSSRYDQLTEQILMGPFYILPFFGIDITATNNNTNQTYRVSWVIPLIRHF